VNHPAADQRLQIAAVELFVDVLGRADDDGQDRFYSRLAEAVCELGSMRRAVIFRYDERLRRVRAAGGYGVDLERFDELEITSQSSPLARRALDEDRVLELWSDFERELPQAAGLLSGAPIVCTPMGAAGRRVGVILSDRGPDAPPLSHEQRDLLWSLGKMAALAAVARIATAQRERARHLETRLDLAREVHERVIQRLFGVSLALSADHEFAADDLRRCAEEVQAAMGDLRAALQRPLSPTARPSRPSLQEELRRLSREHAGLLVDADASSLGDLPEQAADVVGLVVAEAVRNAYKHAAPTRVDVTIRRSSDTLVAEVRNDGVVDGGRRTGMGLRLAAFEALQVGGVVEFGQRDAGTWQVRLVVPLAAVAELAG
jgi:signal transduction histidine kinase